MINITFAVDKSNDEKWRFRLDHIRDFECYRTECLYRNHECLISIIDGFLELYENQASLILFNNLKKIADTLKSSKDENYFVILTNTVKDKLRDTIEDKQKKLKDKSKLNNRDKTKCACLIQ